MFKKISKFFLFFLIFLILPLVAMVNQWDDGNQYANYNNPAWRRGPLRIDTENSNAYNVPFLYERYSEIPDNEQVVPYGYQPYRTVHPEGYGPFVNRHRNYYRSVIQEGYYYRNMRW